MKEKTGFFTILKAYFRFRLKTILMLCVFAAVFAGVFLLHRIRIDAVLYASLLCSIIGILLLAADLSSFYKRHRLLQAAATNITVSLEHLPSAKTLPEQDYQRLLRILYEDRSRIITENEAARDYLSDYYAMWVHQIKVPISAMHLLLEKDSKSSPLHIELFKIEQYVEMALSYVRLESDHTDYLLKEYDVEAIVKQAVRKYAPLFITKKISLDISPIDITALTDEKWLRFVIEQILSNSLKYTKKGRISIYTETPKTLVIEDTGIGIAPEDIGRIGQKGFTGFNGRHYQKSTGLGLYLCTEILHRLSHTMTIESEVDRGTQVRIHLDRRRMLME